MSEDHPVGEAPGDSQCVVEEDVSEQARRIADDTAFDDEWLRDQRKYLWDRVTYDLAFINTLDVALELREKRRG